MIAATLELAAFGLGQTAGVVAFRSLVASGVAVLADAGDRGEREPRLLRRHAPRRRPDREVPAAAGVRRGLVSHRFDADTAVRPGARAASRRASTPAGGWCRTQRRLRRRDPAARARARAGRPGARRARLTIHYTAPPDGGARVDRDARRADRPLAHDRERPPAPGRKPARARARRLLDAARGLEFADLRRPEVPPPEDCPAFEKRIEIHDRYEQRWAIGAPPFSGGERALAGGWIRFREPRPLDALRDRRLRRRLPAGGLLARARSRARGRRADHRPDGPLPRARCRRRTPARRLGARGLPLAPGARRLRRGGRRDLDPRRYADRAVAPARAAAMNLLRSNDAPVKTTETRATLRAARGPPPGGARAADLAARAQGEAPGDGGRRAHACSRRAARCATRSTDATRAAWS